VRLVDLLTIAAILLGPVIAIQISTYLAKRKDARSRKQYVFKTLMASRASRLAFEHVQALNMIDIEFYGNKSKNKAVLDAWKEYLDLLSNSSLKEKSADVWNAKADDLFIELMYKMALALGYEFDRTAIKNTSYMPVAHGTMEDEQNIIRRGFAAVFKGEAALPMEVIRPEPTPEEIEEQRKQRERQGRMDQLQEDYLSGKVAQKVIVVRDEAGILSAGQSPKLLDDHIGEHTKS